MDINDLNVNDLRIAVTLLSFALFAGIVRWAWTRSNRTRFDEAALLPFINDKNDPTADGAAHE
jgi:cytochrome c oxidase cbb3-type subunit IV